MKSILNGSGGKGLVTILVMYIRRPCSTFPLHLLSFASSLTTCALNHSRRRPISRPIKFISNYLPFINGGTNLYINYSTLNHKRMAACVESCGTDDSVPV